MTPVNNARPPPHTVELGRWSLTDANGLRTLRLSLCEALASQRIDPASDPDEVAERITLVATELATNALQHGQPPTSVRLLRHDERFFLDVVDHAPDEAPHVPAATPASHRGRGLAIARSMSLQVGWYATGATKHIWASFPLRN